MCMLSEIPSTVNNKGMRYTWYGAWQEERRGRSVETMSTFTRRQRAYGRADYTSTDGAILYLITHRGYVIDRASYLHPHSFLTRLPILREILRDSAASDL